MAVLESVSLLNSVVRTILAVVVVGGVGVAGWFGYSTVHEKNAAVEKSQQELAAARTELEKSQAVLEQQGLEIRRQGEQIASQAGQIDDLEEDVRQKAQKIERLDTAMRLLKVDHRLARMTVLDQGTDPDTGQLFSEIRFVEVDHRGEALEDPRTFTIRGDVVYVDHWVVKFEEKYVEEADLLRSASLVMFRRVFGEFQEPTEGFAIDEKGRRPTAYGGGTIPNDFEEKIWEDFWTIANDPDVAASMGIRAAHGEAVSMKVRKGRSYKLLLRASDGLSIVPDGTPGL